MSSYKDRLLGFYEKNETKVDISFFLGGVLFDILTLSAIDDPLAIVQQVGYLLIIGLILNFDFLQKNGLAQIPARLERAWHYRDLAVHFLMGSLLSLYSLFFLKSASIFSSFIFIFFLVALMVANEMKSVQKSEINLKIGLYVICVFSFFSMMFPVLLGFVGWIPFLLALAATIGFLYGVYRLLLKKVKDPNLLLPVLIAPGSAVVILFFVFYLMGWIPPVPLSVQKIGIYHAINKVDGQYMLSHENPWWRFWKNGDQDFVAQEGDSIFVFVSVFSPARFSDSVVLHWQYDDPREGWKTTDRIPMKISGGREGGYRGFASKQKYTPGDWRILVETTNHREIGRLGFQVRLEEQPYPDRYFDTEIQ
jgi:hypothetical protein